MKKQRLKAYREVWGGLPPRLKVGPHWWKVSFVEDLVDSTGSRMLFGEIDNIACVVNLSPSQSFDQARDTVLHELLHAAFTNTICFARKKTRPDEEGVIRSVTPFLLDVLRDNPELVQWLQKEETA